jgi:hypothetical protein
MKKKLIPGIVFTLVLGLSSVSVFAATVTTNALHVNLGYNCYVDCHLQADGASGTATTRAYVSNSSYRAKAYVEACIGSYDRITSSGWVTNNGGDNYISASLSNGWNATEYHSSHTCSGPASIKGMMVRLNGQ